MAEIRELILEKFGVDLERDNILKLYKVDSETITSSELENKIQETRKRWVQSINGANEKNAKRDGARLEKADAYESILRDEKLRKEVFRYYQGDKGGSGGGGNAHNVDFAMEYFRLIATTKKINQKDVDFFFRYYQDQRKYKKDILEKLGKDLKLGKKISQDQYADEDDETDEEGEKKDKKRHLVTNLFQEATFLQVQKCCNQVEKAKDFQDVCQRYPAIKEGLYTFLDIESTKSAKEFAERVAEKGQEVYTVRQEKGTNYVPLVDILNIMKSVAEYRDVVDNFEEFKLLLKYPSLTPYMHAFGDMKPTTVKGISQIAEKTYDFTDETDFLNSYFLPVHDNFGVTVNGIKPMLRRARSKAASNKLLKKIGFKFVHKKSGLSLGAKVVYGFAYWHLFLAFFLVEIIKFLIDKFRLLLLPIFAVLLVGLNIFWPKLLGIDNILVLRKLIDMEQWQQIIGTYLGVDHPRGFLLYGSTIFTIIANLLIYIIPSVLIPVVLSYSLADIHKNFDLIGLERTMLQNVQLVQDRAGALFCKSPKLFYKKHIPRILINFLCVIVLGVGLNYAGVGIGQIPEKTDGLHFNIWNKLQNPSEEITKTSDSEKVSENVEEEQSQVEVPNEEQNVIMVIKDNGSNIRSGPGTKYNVVQTANKGDKYIATGNYEKPSGGGVWYEIYLNEEKTDIGWASEKVIGFEE